MISAVVAGKKSESSATTAFATGSGSLRSQPERGPRAPRLLEQLEAGDALRRDRAQRAGGHEVDPDPLGPEVAGEVAGGRLERRLRHAHPVVDRPRLGVVEVEADDRAAALHQRQRRDRQRLQRVRRHLQGDRRRPPTVRRGTRRRGTTPARTRSRAPRRRACRRRRRRAPARSSLLVTSSSTSCASSGSRRAARVVRLMIRPNDVSTTSAPCSWATRAIENAIDSLFNTPVTRIRLPWSSIGAAYVTDPGPKRELPCFRAGRSSRFVRNRASVDARTRRVSDAAITSST